MHINIFIYNKKDAIPLSHSITEPIYGTKLVLKVASDANVLVDQGLPFLAALLIICMPTIYLSLCAGMRSSGGRTLLQKSPGADGAISGAGSTQSDTKIRASGDRCYISSDTKARLDCSKQGTGTYDQQVPACCTSTSRTSSNLCSTFDNAGSISCNSARVYPACCEYR